MFFWWFDKKTDPKALRETKMLYLCSVKRDQCRLGYGVMVTQQILVLFFLVRIRVAQLIVADVSPRGRSRRAAGYTVWAMV